MKKCKIDWCERDSRVHGYCYLHYKRVRRGTDLNKPIRGTLKNCTVPGCTRAMLSNGLCNAHYIRKKNGKDLNTPIWEKKIKCIVCGEKINHGGQGRCTLHYRQYLKKTRSRELINLLGGKCSHCNKEYPIGVYDFHHIDPKKKKFSVSAQILVKSMEELKKEASKCILLCANCHRILHYGTNGKQLE